MNELISDLQFLQNENLIHSEKLALILSDINQGRLIEYWGMEVRKIIAMYTD